MKDFRGASMQKRKNGEQPRGVAGWLFRLHGGRFEGVTVRLPWSLSRETLEAYRELPEVFEVDGERYRKTLLWDVKGGGGPLMVKAGGVEVQEVRYEHESLAVSA